MRVDGIIPSSKLRKCERSAGLNLGASFSSMVTRLMWSQCCIVVFVIDWPMGTQPRALYLGCSLDPLLRKKILADVAWRQRLERYCVKIELCPNFTKSSFILKAAVDMIKLEIRLIHSPVMSFRKSRHNPLWSFCLSCASVGKSRRPTAGNVRNVLGAHTTTAPYSSDQ